MSQQIEIERKTMLTEAEFELLLKKLPFESAPIIQTNYYFETEDLALKRNLSALRIRQKNNSYTLTLKEPHEEGVLETNEPLTEVEAKKWLQNKPIPTGKIANQLEALSICLEDLRYIGSLKTERYTYSKDDIHFMLDKSFYLQTIDYELEIEATSLRQAEEEMCQILLDYDIEERTALPKIARFFHKADEL